MESDGIMHKNLLRLLYFTVTASEMAGDVYFLSVRVFVGRCAKLQI